MDVVLVFCFFFLFRDFLSLSLSLCVCSVFTLDYTHNIARSVQISPARVRKEVDPYTFSPPTLTDLFSSSFLQQWLKAIYNIELPAWTSPVKQNVEAVASLLHAMLYEMLAKKRGCRLSSSLVIESRYCHRHTTPKK